MNYFWDLPEAFFRGSQRYEKSARIKSQTYLYVLLTVMSDAVYLNNSSLLASSLRNMNRNMVKVQRDDPP
jgi:hypothetical protein